MESALVKRDEVVKALRKIKCGKAAKVDGIALEFIKKAERVTIKYKSERRNLQGRNI